MRGHSGVARGGSGRGGGSVGRCQASAQDVLGVGTHGLQGMEGGNGASGADSILGDARLHTCICLASPSTCYPAHLRLHAPQRYCQGALLLLGGGQHRQALPQAAAAQLAQAAVQCAGGAGAGGVVGLGQAQQGEAVQPRLLLESGEGLQMWAMMQP